MASIVTHFPLNNFSKQHLAQVFIEDELNLPQSLTLNEHALALLVTDDEQASLIADHSIELVVFSTLTLAELFAISQECDITLIALTAINHRASLTSFRFAINCPSLEKSVNLLADFTRNQAIEAAIIQHAPLLSEPGLLVMDMDSTTIEIECIDEIAVLAGVGEQVAEVTERAMQGELDFAQSLHQRVATLANAPESILAEVVKDIPLMAGLTTLVDTLKAHKWRVAIASGGFTYFADHLQQRLGLDAAHANVLEIVDNKLTGNVIGDVVDAQAKAECLVQLADTFNVKATQTVAMGDGANDLVMMKAAHLGVAFHAKPIVVKQADTTINNAGLDLMLHWLA
ncbi:phosphoserine phosphatase SerB [Thalassotalea sp. 1_MG-2023]|uniref:phosphoserine phosphatase SerB n=1 Tax=Thalassotalea sp. 1_MG-2023 TaxID=3062680 RepID=UPI0026E23378|nr:phosphoserine phosphatase SerB [Thalassotalea sp. 1_MG-2023]MDO6428503.1 phosphoserine phosphatase SerB [Thalassotalea sp. 1_MG-2023]